MNRYVPTTAYFAHKAHYTIALTVSGVLIAIARGPPPALYTAIIKSEALPHFVSMATHGKMGT
jgi:hypothetical protein